MDKERLKVKGSEKYTREIIIVRQNRLFGKKREYFIIKLCSLGICNNWNLYVPNIHILKIHKTRNWENYTKKCTVHPFIMGDFGDNCNSLGKRWGPMADK